MAENAERGGNETLKSSAVNTSGDDTEAFPEARRCDVCHQHAFKYRCPRCSTRSCCLACINQHKADMSCTGKRDRTAYVPMADLSLNHLRSDLSFLEDVETNADSARRQVQHTIGSGNSATAVPLAPSRLLPHHLASLKHQAHLRGTELLFQPPGMTKRKQNNSQWVSKKKIIIWRIELEFILGEEESNPGPPPKKTLKLGGGQGTRDQVSSSKEKASMILTAPRTPETQTLSDIISRFLELQPGRADAHHRLREFVDAGVENLTVLLKVERRPAGQPLWWSLPLYVPLKDILRGCCIIEFPRFQILTPQQVRVTKEYVMVPKTDT